MVTGDERAMFSGAVVREGSAEPDAMLRGHWHGREGLWRMRHGKLSCGTIPGRGCADVGRVLSGNGSREGIGVEDRPAMMRRWQNRATGVPDRVVDEMGGGECLQRGERWCYVGWWWCNRLSDVVLRALYPDSVVEEWRALSLSPFTHRNSSIGPCWPVC
jgi:hypothetical protein